MCFTTVNKVEPCFVEANLPLCFETLHRFSWSYHTIVAGPKVTENSAENIVILSCHEIKVTCTTVQFSQVSSCNGTIFCTGLHWMYNYLHLSFWHTQEKTTLSLTFNRNLEVYTRKKYNNMNTHFKLELTWTYNKFIPILSLTIFSSIFGSHNLCETNQFI